MPMRNQTAHKSMDYPETSLSSRPPAGSASQPGASLARVRCARLALRLPHHPRAASPKHGREYYFVSDQKFDTMVSNNAFVEWANVHSHRRYGHGQEGAGRAHQVGTDMLEIDYQGALQVEKRFRTPF
ncbi:Peripheral plasma membrane protein CASK [Manis javanica]|nr:Peripheral plasma membrane protein CASK [Manis javanica]